MLADAGYCHPAGIAAVVAAQADVCVRLNPHALPLLDERGEVFSPLAPLAKLRTAGKVAEWAVWIRTGEKTIAGRVCAIRKSREAIAQAQRRLKLKQQNGKNVGPETRFYAAYVLVFTTLAVEAARAQQVLDAYRLRWQVEFNFKRLKSIAQIGHVPKQDEKVVVHGYTENCWWPC